MAPHITTEPGGPIEPGQTRSQAIDLFVEVLKPLAEHAHDRGVMLLIEPEPGLLLETTDQYLEVAERVNAPSIGLNFDVGHAFCVRENLPGAIAKLAPHIRHYHLEDIAASRVHHHLVPGTGAIDFAEVVSAIRKTGYDGWLTVELYPFQDDPDAAARRRPARSSPAHRAGACKRSPMTTRAGMPRSLVPYLQLVRLPNVLTAPADSLAGWLLVGGSLADVRHGCHWPRPRCSCMRAAWRSMTCSTSRTDRIERPGRPLPSGRSRERSLPVS